MNQTLKTILTIVVVVLVIYGIYKFFSKDTISLSSLKPANVEEHIDADKLPNNNSNNFAYSMWFYVSDWNYRFGSKKIILHRMGKDGGSCPSVSLGATENDIDITLATMKGDSTCSVANVPIQKWVNLIISVNGRSLDVYIDGKLVRTCLLPGIAKVNTNGDCFITPDGGFSGYTANFQGFNKPVNPQEAYNIYMAGFGGSSLANLFKYHLRIELLENSNVKGQVTI